MAALMLGRIDIARACRERVLLVARQQYIIWRIPASTFHFALLLLMLGEYNRAHAFFLDALRYDIRTPVVYMWKVTVGIEIALALGNSTLLDEMLDERAVELAFQSTQNEHIGPLAAAYIKAFVSRGQLRQAKALVERGVSAVVQVDKCGELLALAARYGSLKTAQRARALLVARMQFPHHRVAEAYLALWDAYAAMRRRAVVEANDRAQYSATLFGRLGWKHHQTEALAVMETKKRNLVPQTSMQTPILVDLASTLTRREQQVAELVVRGLPNRTIAQMLNISEHTVEAHMTSILSRLGLRSRWQLVHAAL
jgi:DNA-binding NarL/FixJ family response regulator